MDILQSALDADDRSHLMVALPTGYGKTMPMLLLGHLLPAGRNHLELQKKSYFFFLPGSFTIVMTPTTTIGQQLVADCRKLGIDSVSSGELRCDIVLVWRGIYCQYVTTTQI